MDEWTNWSGSLKFKPSTFLQPSHEDELRQIMQRAYREGRKVKIAGAGHSSSPLVKTDQLLLRLDHFKGIVSRDELAQTATLKTGMTVHDANSALQELNLALFNTGDVDVQMLAGAISTGTHGSGRKLQNLSSMLTGVRLINYKGDVETYSEADHPERMKAIRVSLGSLGIFTEITVKVLPVFELKRFEFFTDVDTCLHHFDQIADDNRNADFYWYPRSDETKIRVLNEPGKGSTSFNFQHRCTKSEQGLVGEILPRHRDLKFDEMEYSLPREAGLECFQAVRKRIKDRHRKESPGACCIAPWPQIITISAHTMAAKALRSHCIITPACHLKHFLMTSNRSSCNTMDDRIGERNTTSSAISSNRSIVIGVNSSRSEIHLILKECS
jgi:hypothetical protein